MGYVEVREAAKKVASRLRTDARCTSSRISDDTTVHAHEM